MNTITDFWPFGVAASVVSGGWCFITLAARWQWAMDKPNERSLHNRPVPRTGGLGILVAVLLAGALTSYFQDDVRWPWAESLLAAWLSSISSIDDKRGLSASVRLLAQAIGALVYVVAIYRTAWIVQLPLPFWAASSILIVAIVGMSNFYNFMDGANGLAGTMGLVGFGAYAIAFAPDHGNFASLCLTISGAALGFLAFNMQGRIFMGDCGSVPLGSLAACVGVSGWLAGVWPLGFPILVFAPFIADATITLLKRLFRGERVWLAHREHYYQRVIQMGASHTHLAIGEAILMVVCAVAALSMRDCGSSGQIAIFATIGLLLLALMLLIDARWRRHISQLST